MKGNGDKEKGDEKEGRKERVLFKEEVAWNDNVIGRRFSVGGLPKIISFFWGTSFDVKIPTGDPPIASACIFSLAGMRCKAERDSENTSFPHTGIHDQLLQLLIIMTGNEYEIGDICPPTMFKLL